MNAVSRRMGWAAGAAWVVAGGAASWSAAFDSGDDWELTYTIFAAGLPVAGGLTVALAAAASRGTSRPVLRRLGLVVGGLGVLASVAAWALPLWMSLLGAGLALIAWSSPPPARRAVAVFAGGQAAGLVMVVAGEAAGIGRTDEWGDHPLAGGIGVAIVVAATIAGLVMLGDRGVAASGPRSAAAVAPRTT